MNAEQLLHIYVPSRVLKEIYNKDYLIGALEAMYDQPKRYYHNLDHLRDILTRAEIVEAEQKEWGLPKLSHEFYAAVLFHDIVYDLRAEKGVNERYSTVMAIRILERCAYRNAFDIPLISDLIDATTHAGDLTDSEFETQLIVDLDMSNFVNFAELNAATQKLIQEKETVHPQKAAINGRIAFLKKLVVAPHIYYSRYFVEHSEKARENMRLEIMILEEQLNR